MTIINKLYTKAMRRPWSSHPARAENQKFPLHRVAGILLGSSLAA
jgi:hypothetical protein